MTKLKSRSCNNSSLQHKGGILIKLGPSYDKSSDTDQLQANVLTKQTETSVIFSDNNSNNPLDQKLTEKDHLTVDSQCESRTTTILRVGDCTVLPEQNGEEVVRCEESERERAFSGTLVKVCEEIKVNKQNSTSICLPPLWGLTSVCGRRHEMEDSAVALPQFLKIPNVMVDNTSNLNSIDQDSIGHVFGVYDGHGGCEVANYCRDRLHLLLAEEIGIAKQTQQIGTGEDLWMKVFLNSFHKMDDEVGGYSTVDGDISFSNPTLPPIAPDSVGSTAVVAVVCSTHIIVANCGDSRAVLCREKAPMPLSMDHKPNREDECTRIEAAGGKVINWNGYRVSGFLAVSRSIGDRYLRPYVIADPEVTFVPRMKEDECLILASDGLWDVMTNEEACDLARRCLLLWHKKNGPISPKERGKETDPAAQEAAEYLSQLAFKRGSRDNISVIVIDLKAHRKFRKKT